MNLIQIKFQYNEVLERVKKAEKFFKIASSEEVDKWRPQYYKLFNQLILFAKQYRKLTGYNMSNEEGFNGFVMSPEALDVTKEVLGNDK